ncbi:MAG: DUF2461 family protein [Thermoleophilia bacterium]
MRLGRSGFRANRSCGCLGYSFDDHRAECQTFYLEPGRAFVDSLAERLDVLRPPNFAEPVSSSLFRIFRDTRFGKDKSPYKTHPTAIFGKMGRSKGDGLGSCVVARGGAGNTSHACDARDPWPRAGRPAGANMNKGLRTVHRQARIALRACPTIPAHSWVTVQYIAGSKVRSVPPKKRSKIAGRRLTRRGVR